MLHCKRRVVSITFVLPASWLIDKVGQQGWSSRTLIAFLQGDNHWSQPNPHPSLFLLKKNLLHWFEEEDVFSKLVVMILAWVPWQRLLCWRLLRPIPSSGPTSSGEPGLWLAGRLLYIFLEPTLSSWRSWLEIVETYPHLQLIAEIGWLLISTSILSSIGDWRSWELWSIFKLVVGEVESLDLSSNWRLEKLVWLLRATCCPSCLWLLRPILGSGDWRRILLRPTLVVYRSLTAHPQIAPSNSERCFLESGLVWAQNQASLSIKGHSVVVPPGQDGKVQSKDTQEGRPSYQDLWEEEGIPQEGFFITIIISITEDT